MLQAANLDDLKKAGMVRDDCESREKYSDTVAAYLKPYADYYKAVEKKDDDSSASSSLLSLHLHIFAVFAIAILI